MCDSGIMLLVDGAWWWYVDEILHFLLVESKMVEWPLTAFILSQTKKTSFLTIHLHSCSSGCVLMCSHHQVIVVCCDYVRTSLF